MKYEINIIRINITTVFVPEFVTVGPCTCIIQALWGTCLFISMATPEKQLLEPGNLAYDSLRS